MIPAAGRTGSPAPYSAEPDDAFAPVEVVPSAGATDCAASAAAPRTVRRGWPTPSLPEISVPSGSNAIASPCFSPGSGIRTGLRCKAASTSPSGAAYTYASVYVRNATTVPSAVDAPPVTRTEPIEPTGPP